MSEAWHSKVVNLIVRLDRLAKQDLSRGQLADEATDLANFRDYYMYQVLDASRDQAASLATLFEQLQARCDAQGDRFHTGFFFTLAQLLSLKFQVGIPGEKITRNDFEKSFAETRRKYGL